MDTFESIVSKIDVKEYIPEKKVQAEVKLKTLEAGRLSGSGNNTQHWRFLMLQKREDIKKLAEDSTSGKWVENCNYAIVVLTDPSLSYHMIDAGRAVQAMQLAAWNYGVASRIFTGVDKQKLRKDFGIPDKMDPTIMAGFGYPKKKITGKRKKRNDLSDVAHVGMYGNKFDQSKLE
ncbi:MAG: nitroreductase family protein [Nitrososphaerales archaeon]